MQKTAKFLAAAEEGEVKRTVDTENSFRRLSVSLLLSVSSTNFSNLESSKIIGTFFTFLKTLDPI